MKTLNQHIQEKLIINQRFDEKLIINKNYKSVSYDFNDVKELYLIRFFLSDRMSVNIIDIKNIKMKYDNNYGSKCIVNGDFRLWKNCYYLNHVFKCDSANGTLYRDDGPYARYCDVLIHETLKGNFKKFVEYISKNPYETYSINDVFDILNIKCPEFENKYKKAEYDRIDNADDPIFMDKLKKSLNIK